MAARISKGDLSEMPTWLDQQIEELESLVEKHLDFCAVQGHGIRRVLPRNHKRSGPHKFAPAVSAGGVENRQNQLPKIAIERIVMNQEITNPAITGSTPNPETQRNYSRRQPGPGPLRYGLPCANCRIYYEAEFAACPICGCGERMSAATEFAHIAAML
jgi:hypothetical protein